MSLLTLPTAPALFCAARIPLQYLQKAAHHLLLPDASSPAPTDFSALAPGSTLPIALHTTPTTPTPTTLTIHRLLTYQNDKLVALCTLLPTSGAPPLTVIAKLRTTATPAAHAAHAHELAMLRLVSASPLFPALLGHGTAGAQRTPLLLLQWLPFPSVAGLLRGAGRGGGDKRALQRDGALWRGVAAVVGALRAVGARQADLRGANLVYDVGGGRVWGVDLEGVEVVAVGEGVDVDVEGVVEEFWRFELCCVGGRVW